MVDTPEITRLRCVVDDDIYEKYGDDAPVPLSDAIQAARDTEVRTAREIVEALRERAHTRRALGSFERDALTYAADHVARTFLNGEGSDAR